VSGVKPPATNAFRCILTLKIAPVYLSYLEIVRFETLYKCPKKKQLYCKEVAERHSSVQKKVAERRYAMFWLNLSTGDNTNKLVPECLHCSSQI